MNRHPDLLAKGPHAHPTTVEIDAIAALLHSFYTGVENLFKRISIALDGGFPKSPAWHIQLLDSMARPTENRGAVISSDLRTALRTYLDFRHVFRHAYTFELNWSKMAPLVVDCPATFRKLEQELTRFLV